jgi:hypothetical protein
MKLAIFNILGQRMRILIDEEQDVGYYQPEFEISRTNNGAELPSGVYFYKLEIAGVSITKKNVIVKIVPKVIVETEKLTTHPRQCSNDKRSQSYLMMDAEKDISRRVTTTSLSLTEDMSCKMLCASCIAFLYIFCWNVRKKVSQYPVTGFGDGHATQIPLKTD